jgi:hypothetical protein
LIIEANVTIHEQILTKGCFLVFVFFFFGTTKRCFYRDTIEIEKKSENDTENHILVSLNSAKNYIKSFFLFFSARGKLTEHHSVNYHCRYTWYECASRVKDSIVS